MVFQTFQCLQSRDQLKRTSRPDHTLPRWTQTSKFSSKYSFFESWDFKFKFVTSFHFYEIYLIFQFQIIGKELNIKYQIYYRIQSLSPLKKKIDSITKNIYSNLQESYKEAAAQEAKYKGEGTAEYYKSQHIMVPPPQILKGPKKGGMKLRPTIMNN